MYLNSNRDKKNLKQGLVSYSRGLVSLSWATLVLFLLLMVNPAVAGTRGITGSNNTSYSIESTATKIAKPAIGAKAFVLMEAASGQVLYASNMHERRHQASTTKITTAIVALEKGKLTDQVKVSKRAAETPESAIWLEDGEVLTLDQLMYALMLFSANDAAAAIAEHIGGTEEKFVEMMNVKAREIGAKDSHYMNPHGLDNPNHYTSAYDLALLARYGLNKVPGFAKLVSTTEQNIPWAGHPYERVLHNRNKLLAQYPGADGVKTGYTNLAGRCLVGSATREGMQLIAVVMDSPDMFKETATLMDWGFAHFKKKQVVSKQSKFGKIRVINGFGESVSSRPAEDLTVALTPEDLVNVKIEISLPQQIEAPVQQGQKLGIMKINLPGEPVRSIYLVCDQSIERKGKWELFWEYLSSWLGF